MAYASREIEVKTPISKRDYLRIRRLLNKKTKFVKLVKQVDTYYSPTGALFLKPKHPFEWLSLRERDGRVIINYKHWYPEGEELTKYCDEYESGIADKKQFQKLLKALKFEELVAVKKVRYIFVKNDLEISLDNVEVLGHFIEVESLKNTGGVNKTRKKILNFIKELGIDSVINVPGGYAYQLIRKKRMVRS